MPIFMNQSLCLDSIQHLLQGFQIIPVFLHPFISLQLYPQFQKLSYPLYLFLVFRYVVLTGTEIRTVYTMIHLLSAGQFQWFETYSKWHFHCI